MLNHPMTQRQSEVVDMLLSGKSIAEIASHYTISPSAVKCSLTAIYKKHDVQNSRELMALYIQHYRELAQTVIPKPLTQEEQIEQSYLEQREG